MQTHIGLYPRRVPRPTKSHAEQSLYRALATQLPGGWTAWHSLRLRTERGWEGEGDFVFAIPDRGILVLEVKGGAIEERDGHWYQNGRRLDHAPRDQAHRFRRILEHALHHALGASIPYIGIATAFPDTPFEQEPTQGDLHDTVIGQQHLGDLEGKLRRVADALLEPATGPRSSAFIGALHRLWGETWKPRLSLGQRVELRERELVMLDQAQLELLDALSDNRRLLVLGGPGTGKTLLAREAIHRKKEQGARVLYVCWTRGLAAALRADGLEDAWAVRDFADDILRRSGAAPPEQERVLPTSDMWELIAGKAAVSALPLLGLAYDAVVVDEAQDFAQSDWELVCGLAKGGTIWAFGDDGQRFWAERAWPLDLFEARFRLMRAYRCPEALAHFADLYRPAASGDGADIAPPARDPAPVLALALATGELRIVRVSSEASIADKVALEIDRALADRAHPGDLAVLSVGGQKNTLVATASRIGGRDVVRVDDEAASQKLVADTFLRFKGLERPWIIVTELGRGERSYELRMHIALSRATVGCTIIATDDEVEADPRLRAEAVADPE
jgi:hypothetical protein